MHTRSSLGAALLALTAVVMISGCGDGNDEDIFVGSTPTPVDGRTPTPVRTVTPQPNDSPTVTAEGPTATPTPGTDPTATSTPSGATCSAGDQVVVVASLDKAYGAARIDLGYPASLNVPGTGPSADVASRVDFGPSGGLTTVNDNDTNSDSVDDTLTASLVSFSDNAPGVFVTVTFDCVAGQAAPSAADVTCNVVSASTSGGVAIPDQQCTLTVTGP